jgi:NCS1 family nucleobase:cation symporter-1
MVALLAGIAPNVPGFLHSVHVLGGEPGIFTDIYPYAWFTGVVIAAAVYVMGMSIRPGFGVPVR